jgi:putative ABC transport system permease protein
MSLWSRIANTFRGSRVDREIDEELASHFAEGIREGRDPAEVRQAFGSALQIREASRDLRFIAWLESLRVDAIFGWRQLMKRKVTSTAAILSLALAIGACASAFRLIDALLLRPLPVADPGNLYVLLRHGLGFADGKPRTSDSYEYPLFRQMRAAVQGNAELIAAGYSDRVDLTYGTDLEVEQARRQYVSGAMFPSLGLRPALGRLFTGNDDLTLGAHPVAVMSYDYWKRRFAQDPNVIGRRLRVGNDLSQLFEIVGVAGERFTGTEPGTVTDLFFPTMMNAMVENPGSAWLRIFVRLHPGAPPEPVRQRLAAVFRAWNEDRAKGFTGGSKQFINRFLGQSLLLEPAAAGASGMQQDYRLALVALSVLVALVLLIASANVANLMMAQAAARAREMALRLSIGAGRWRLVQLVLVESAWIAFLASAIGACFAWWAAPFVVGLVSSRDNPVRLILSADWRVIAFGVVLALAVTFLFGLGPALRASAIQPVTALRGGTDPHARRRLMHVLIAAQVAFCFIVQFVAGLFVGTFEKLANQPVGFSAERLLILNAVSPRPTPPVLWDQVADHLRSLPGVETVAMAAFPLLSGSTSNGFIAINGGTAEPGLVHFLTVSPGWIDAMKISLTDGRDLSTLDTYPGAAIVNATFAQRFFAVDRPVGKWFERLDADGKRIRLQVVGLIPDARYQDLREPITPTVYVPFQSRTRTSFIIRTSSHNPLALGSILRSEVRRARPEFRVGNVRTQLEINQAQTVRERLLAMLAFFFSAVALVLAGIGLYGVLDYGVLQRQREIGIRVAIGARAGDIARRVTAQVFGMVAVGAAVGLALAMLAVRYIEALLYQVKATDIQVLATPALAIVAAALLAAAPAVARAVRIDPVAMLRVD